ncbi:uncharacterized protein LOC134655174 [Cydia amplana]|uniref:uncharacterized protein LOC134655174 n=1 Tax=Cydia amplana TaxID=1869771 RepID=UPI002FE63E4E
MYSISLQVVDLQGYLWLTAYFHYYTPGNLRLKTTVHQVPIYRLRELIDNAPATQDTRRWNMKHESPYPGYCRAPGRADCLPLLCDCDFLKQEWSRKRGNNGTVSGNTVLLYKIGALTKT